MIKETSMQRDLSITNIWNVKF